MQIKILGKNNCDNCKKLNDYVEKALKELNMKGYIEKVTDENEIVSYGVLSLPALVVEEKLITSGKVPTYEEVKEVMNRR